MNILKHIRAIAAPTLALSLSLCASAQTVRTLVSNGPSSELYDIVILAEGYRASEQATFDSDAQDVIAHLRDTPQGFPYDSYFHCYNIHSVFRASAQSGADQPDLARPIRVDTAYDATFNVGGTPRCLYLGTNSGLVQAAMDTVLAPDSDGRVMVLVNTQRRGGCALAFSVSSNDVSMPEVQAHEWGHSFGRLADEYVDLQGTFPGPEPSAANITMQQSGAKWSQWLGVFGSRGVVGAFEGAGRYPLGVFRPERDCKMRTTRTSNFQPFCAVCREQLIKTFHRECTMLVRSSAGANVSIAQHDSRTFSVRSRVPAGTADFEWQIDNGPWFAGSERFSWQVGDTPTGAHRVRARVFDTTTWVRNDPANDLRHEVTWNVNVTSALPTNSGFTEVLPASAHASAGSTSTSFPFSRSAPMRVMYAYSRDTISPDGVVEIRGIRLRPQETNAAFAGATYQFSLDVSTSQRPADDLDRSFDRNHGADRSRVFDGALTVPAIASQATPRPFGLVIPFDKAVQWNPGSGPLLLDFRMRGRPFGAGLTVDAANATAGETVGRIAHTSSVDVPTANFPPSGGTQSNAVVVDLVLSCAAAPRTLANVEGGSSTSLPWSRTLGTACRTMNVYDGTAIGLSVPTKISRLAWRPERGTAFLGTRDFDVTISLSTGAVGASTSLNTVFNANHGPDRVEVFDGIAHFDSSPPSSAPAGFIYAIELQRPFTYDPAQGSLVVDIQLHSSTGTSSSTSFDGALNTGAGAGRVFSTVDDRARIGTTQDFAMAMCVSGVPDLVAPRSAAGTSGNRSSNFPWNRSSGSRVMSFYDPSGFGYTQPITINHLSWRPQQGAAPYGPAQFSARIDLSTGAEYVNSLSVISTVFDDNHGADRKTVLDGPISVPRRSFAGTPADWLITVRLDQPFRWDPVDGPLIVDIRCDGLTAGMAGISFDGSNAPGDVASLTHTSNPNATTASASPSAFALNLRLGGEGANGTATPIGRGCPGAAGRPVASVLSLPWTGNDDFGYVLDDGPPSASVAGLFATRSASVPLSALGIPCDLLVTNIFASVPGTTTRIGRSFLVSPVSADPSLEGFSLTNQWICLDPSAAGGITTSNATRIVVAH